MYNTLTKGLLDRINTVDNLNNSNGFEFYIENSNLLISNSQFYRSHNFILGGFFDIFSNNNITFNACNFIRGTNYYLLHIRSENKI